MSFSILLRRKRRIAVIVRLGRGLILVQRLYQVVFRNRAQLCTSGMVAPAAHRQVGRRPSVSFEAQPLEKLFFDENFRNLPPAVRPGIPAR